MPVVTENPVKSKRLRNNNRIGATPSGEQRFVKRAGKAGESNPSAGSIAQNLPLQVREGLGVKQPDFARMTGYSVRSVAGWEAGQAIGPSARLKLSEMDRLRDGLASVMAAEHIGLWLKNPNRAFGGQSPLQIIERGEIDRLWRMIYQLDAGVAS